MRPCHFTLALTVSCSLACSVWQSARESETPAHVRQFPWNNAVIPSGIDWGEKGGKGKTNICACTYSRPDWKESQCLFFQATEKPLLFYSGRSKRFCDMRWSACTPPKWITPPVPLLQSPAPFDNCEKNMSCYTCFAMGIRLYLWEISQSSDVRFSSLYG